MLYIYVLLKTRSFISFLSETVYFISLLSETVYCRNNFYFSVLKLETKRLILNIKYIFTGVTSKHIKI